MPLVRNYAVAHTQVNCLDIQNNPLQNINHAPMVEKLSASTLSLTGLHGFGGMVFDRKRCPVFFDERRRLKIFCSPSRFLTMSSTLAIVRCRSMIIT